MVKVEINGTEFSSDLASIKTMAELVELIKASIDPDVIITSLSIEGKELSEADWRTPLSVQGEAVLEVTTGSRETYVSERLALAGLYMEQIVAEFVEVRENFRSGTTTDGNSNLVQAVEDLRAFLAWYNTVQSLLPESNTDDRQSFLGFVDELTSICEQLVQQQLYQSWWALAQTIETKLEPLLLKLQEFCLTCSQQFQE